MPCSDSRNNEPQIIYTQGIDPAWKAASTRLKNRVDYMADLLCKAGRARKNKTNIPADVIKWWEEHCKFDAARGEPW